MLDANVVHESRKWRKDDEVWFF